MGSSSSAVKRMGQVLSAVPCAREKEIEIEDNAEVQKGVPVQEVVKQQPTVTVESSLSDFVPSTESEDEPESDHENPNKEAEEETKDVVGQELDNISVDEEGEDIDLEESTVDDTVEIQKKTELENPHPISDLISEINSESDSRELVLGR